MNLLLLLYLLVVIGGISAKKSKAVFVVEFLMAWVLIAGNYQNADYEQYLIRYDSGLDVFVDIGFSYLCNFFNGLGWSYQEFKTLLSFVCLLLIFRTISKVSRYPALGGAVFLIFPLIIDVTQFRNFVSYSIVVFAIPFLFEKEKSGLFKYIIAVLVASSIHTLSVFYLLFALSRLKLKTWLVGALFLGVLLIKESAKLFFTISFETEKLDNSSTTSIAGAIFNVLIVIANIAIIWYVSKHNKEDLSNKKFLWMSFCTEKTWLYCNCLFVLIIPFLFDFANYSRIYRNMVFLNMIFIANSYYLKRSTKVVIMTSYYLFFIVFNYFTGSYYQEVFFPVFHYNSIL